jgi:non-heme chloroperoxidase
VASITVGTENDQPIDLHYEDHGTGRPVVLIHGFPLALDSWERQQHVLLQAGYRVIAYDRRGFGQSSRPTTGFDYDTFSDDLAKLLDHLDLTDVVLVGFSMGTGEVVRYLGRHGSQRISKAVLVSAIPPFLLQTDDNPEGLPNEVFDEIKAAIVADRYAYFQNTIDDFFAVGEIEDGRYSPQALDAQLQVSCASSPFATLACIDTWLEDFRPDLAKIDVPVLVIQGTIDRNTPIDVTARRLPALVEGLRLIEIEGGPHLIPWTHHEQVNPAILDFLED